MVHDPSPESVPANRVIGHIMQNFGDQLTGCERTIRDLCGRVDSVQSRMNQLESTVVSFWRDIDTKLESTTSPILEQNTTEIENIGDSATSGDAINADESGYVVTFRDKPDTAASDQECQDPSNSDQPPNTPTDGQCASPNIFYGSLTQRMDCMAKLVSTEQIVQTATTDRFNKVFEMLQSVLDHSSNVVTKQDLEALRQKISQDLVIFRRELRQDLETDREATSQDIKLLVEEERQDPKAFKEMKQELKNFRKVHDQRLSTTGHQLNECLANQTNTLETVRNSEARFEQELSSVRDALTRLAGIVIARLPVRDYQPDVVKERQPAFSFAQTTRIDCNPSVDPVDASEASVRLQDRSPRTLQSIAGVAQDCNDPDFEIVSSRRERVGDRAKASGYLAESHSNKLRPDSLAGFLQPRMSSTSPSPLETQAPSVSRLRSTALSKEESAQQLLTGEDVWTEARSSPNQENRQKKQRAKNRVDLAEVLFDPKQPSPRAPTSISSGGEPARGQILRKREWEQSEISRSRADLLQHQQQAYRKRQKKK